MASNRRVFNPQRLIGIGVVVVLLVAMMLNTKFLNPEQLAAALPKPFDAQATAAELFTQAQSELPAQAAPLGDVVTGLQKDAKATAAEFKAVSPGENSYVFAVKGTATVTEATANSLRVSVDGVSPETPVLIPLSTAVNGTTLRDALGFKFADAPGQTAYQYVGDELKKLIQTEVVAPLGDPSALQGKQLEFVGVIAQQGTANRVPTAKPINVQPVSLKAA